MLYFHALFYNFLIYHIFIGPTHITREGQVCPYTNTGTLFYLTSRISVLLRKLRVTPGSDAPALFSLPSIWRLRISYQRTVVSITFFTRLSKEGTADIFVRPAGTVISTSFVRKVLRLSL
jgi:hypothetical protein